MKKDTRNMILESARELFNARGYNGVSLQDIADAVGISKGNLTYHFKKKENIMESLLSMTEHPAPLEIPETLMQLNEVFLDLQNVVQKNSYYFLHHAQLSQISEDISLKQNLVYKDNIKRLHEAFISFNKAGLIRSEEFEGEYNLIIDTLHMASIYWSPFTELQSSSDSSKEYRDYAWNLMYHLLTENGRQEFSKI